MLYDNSMISRLKGFIDKFDDRSVIIDVQGVGYRVFLTQNFRNSLKIGEENEIWTHLAVRENSMDIYGFENKDTLDFFEMLITVSGIGPKTGLNILNIATVEALKEAVSTGDITHLTKVSGIGKKSAEKIVLGLRDKLGLELQTVSTHKEDLDVLEALKSLGYSQNEAREVMQKIPKEIEGTTQRIKEALKILSK